MSPDPTGNQQVGSISRGCSPADKAAPPTGAILVMVMETGTKREVGGVEVRLAPKGGSGATDARGLAVFKSLTPGPYDVQLSLGALGSRYTLPVGRQSQQLAGGDQAAVLFWVDPVHWVEIALVGEDDQPVGGERYRLKLPDGSVKEGKLDPNGRARVEAIARGGECTVAFPDLDKDAWEPV